MRRIVVTPHALEQAAQRLHRPPSGMLRAWVIEEVEAAIDTGRVANHKLDGFLLYGQKRSQLPGRQRFAYSEDERHAWIVVRDEDADVVVTSLFRVGVCR